MGQIAGFTKDGQPIYITDPRTKSQSPVADGNWGYQTIDFGLYAKIKAIPDLTIGVGYAGHKDWVDGHADKKPGVYNSPFQSGINLDVQYVLGALTAGLYNNVSFWSLPEEKKGNQYESSYFFLFDELNLAYKLTEKLTVDLRARNYLSTYTYKGGDDKKYARTVDRFDIQSGVEYQVVPDKAKAWARLQFVNTAYSSAPTDKGWNEQPADPAALQGLGVTEGTSRNHFTFDIPVGIQVKF
jgi:hypothetical protein